MFWTYVKEDLGVSWIPDECTMTSERSSYAALNMDDGLKDCDNNNPDANNIGTGGFNEVKTNLMALAALLENNNIIDQATRTAVNNELINWSMGPHPGSSIAGHGRDQLVNMSAIDTSNNNRFRTVNYTASVGSSSVTLHDGNTSVSGTYSIPATVQGYHSSQWVPAKPKQIVSCNLGHCAYVHTLSIGR